MLTVLSRSTEASLKNARGSLEAALLGLADGAGRISARGAAASPVIRADAR
jgi:hypothetical protein